MAVDYIVQKSNDGGENWWNIEGCEGVMTTCEVKELAAGTNWMFRVLTGGAGGWSEPSQPANAMTEDTSSSKECRDMLTAQAEGNYIATGTIVAIAFGAVAGRRRRRLGPLRRSRPQRTKLVR